MRYIALLRGINVGGNTMLKMSDLRTMFGALSFGNVATYINSGNVAFDTRKSDEDRLATAIEGSIERHLAKPVAVMVRPQQRIRELLNNNPFEGEYESHKEMHVLFLRSELTSQQHEWLTLQTPTGERFEARGREIFCHLPLGVANSYLGRGLFEKKLKISVTARNWRTVAALADL